MPRKNYYKNVELRECGNEAIAIILKQRYKHSAR